MSNRSPFDKKTVYHSAIVKETQDNGALEISILCDGPEPSKFKDKPAQIAFKCYGDTHYYPIENEACGEALSGLKGKTVSIVASGREDTAQIEVQGGSSRREEEPRNERRQERQPERRESRQQEPPASQSPEDRAHEERRAFSAAKVHAARCGVLMDICMHVATGLAEKHLTDAGKQSNPEDVRAIATTLFIETQKSIGINKLPVKWLDKEQTTQRQQERAPDPEPQPRTQEPPPARRTPPPRDDAEIDDIPF